MSDLSFLLVPFALLALLAVLSMRFGVDSREGFAFWDESDAGPQDADGLAPVDLGAFRRKASIRR